MLINKYFLLILMSVAIASVSQILLKMSAEKKHISLIYEYLNVFVITGYVLMVISTILTILSFKGLEYKNGPIIESLGYVFVLLLSKLILHEKVTNKKIIGNLLILFGIILYYI